VHDDPDHQDAPAGASPALSREAMLAAVTEQRERLLAAIMRLTGLARADAEDVLQDVTYSMLDRDVVLDDPAKWFPYLKTAAVNRVRNGMRSAAREDERIGPDVHWLTPGELPDPAEAVGRQMVLLDVLADLATLPEVEREVFWLRHYDDLKPAEIAARLGLRPRQVETRLRQAQRRMDALHARHRESHAYVLLAALLRRVPRGADGATSLVGGPVLNTIAVAAVTAFAMVVTQGAVRGQAPPRSAADITVNHAAATPPAGGLGRGPGPNGTRPVVGAGRATASDPARASHRTADPACVRVPNATSCVTLGADPAGVHAPAGLDDDLLTITVLGISRTVGDGIAPVCDNLPANRVAECTRQGSANRPVKSLPTPAAGGPSPWRSPYVTSSQP
jgi:RNA polymerase sigma factor (sigma-70 family)